MPNHTMFATLAAGRRTWTISSVHGDAVRLAQLHDSLAQRISPQDNLVYLGNVLGRGSQVGETVETVLLFRRWLLARQLENDAGSIVYLRGSQEEMWHKLLQIQFARNPREVVEWMLAQGVGATLQAYGGNIDEARRAASMGAVALSQWTNRLRASIRGADGHDKLMSVLRRAAVTEDDTLLCINAGIDPARPLSQQYDTFWWGSRMFDGIEHPYGGFTRVVRGFDYLHRGVVVGNGIASIDGGCGFGGTLIAACFDRDGALVETVEV